jgi:hypothetical protein
MLCSIGLANGYFQRQRLACRRLQVKRGSGWLEHSHAYGAATVRESRPLWLVAAQKKCRGMPIERRKTL